MTFTFIDLFAGLGGFHVAMESLGGKCVFAAEWEKGLQRLYKENFGVLPSGDVSKISIESVPEHDVLAAGFPCQPFSKAGEQQGFEHTMQGALFFDVLRFLKARNPSYFILENVPNLLKHDKGRTFGRIVHELEAAGYSVDHQKYSPHDFGIPQIRERVYIVGSRRGLDGFEWPTATHEVTDIRDVLGFGIGRPLTPKTLDILETWNSFIRASPDNVLMPSYPLWSMEFGATYPYQDRSPMKVLEDEGPEGLWPYKGIFGTALHGKSLDEILQLLPSHAKRGLREFPTWKKTFLRQNRDFYAANETWIRPFIGKLSSFDSSFQKLEWNAKGEEKDIWKFVIQMRASGVRVKRPTTAPSLIAMTDSQVPIIAWERRYMTPEECAHLQSLENIRLPKEPGKAFKALGNAVNAKVVENILEKLLFGRAGQNMEPRMLRERVTEDYNPPFTRVPSTLPAIAS